MESELHDTSEEQNNLSYTYGYLQEITNNFSEEQLLGTGSFGKVYKGLHKNGEEIAVKLFSMTSELDDKQFQNEFENLVRLKHQNIVQFVGYCHEARGTHVEHKGRIVLAEKMKRILCLEYLHNGSLHKHLSDEYHGHGWHTRYKIIKGICNGLQYLHEGSGQPTCHLDLKPDNILLDKNMIPKIADFGLSKLFGEEQTLKMTSLAGTLAYMPPECFGGNLSPKKFDIFSLGVIIIEIITGRRDYPRSSETSSQKFIELIHENWRNRLKTTLRYTSLEVQCEQVKRCVEIALNCVEIDRTKRPAIGCVIEELNKTEVLIQKTSPFSQESRDALGSPVDWAMRDTVAAAEHVSPRKPGVPVFVMMPLHTGKKFRECELNQSKAMEEHLAAVKSVGAEGITVDVWWGIVESEGPGRYNFAGYMELMTMARQAGLKVQAIMSFHQCCSNGKDAVTIPLPRWVVEEMDKDQDLAYTDQWKRRSYEYVSLGCDALPVLKGRTPVQCYTDFMRAFRDDFSPFLGNTIVEIQVGMGPAGELRYPSYPESDGTWEFPGIGAFQCYDEYMLRNLRAAAEVAGKPEWGSGGPKDAGGYKSWPEHTDTHFFRGDGGGWNVGYGEFFLSWYSQMLLDHGDRVLSGATSVFSHAPGVKISVKVAGVHWHYGTQSHAAELTAGYYNTRRRDGYRPIALMLARHGAVLSFTCLEMRNDRQRQDAQCRPEDLLRQVATAARAAGIDLAGQNALPMYDDEAAHEQVMATAAEQRMVAFTYLRMDRDRLFHEPGNWRRFAAFVKRMNEQELVARARGHRAVKPRIC